MAGKKDKEVTNGKPPVADKELSSSETIGESGVDRETERELRRQQGLARQQQKETLAKMRGAIVVKPLYSPEATSFFNIGQTVENIFEMPVAAKMKRKQKNVHEASRLYREAIIEFSSKMKKVSSLMDVQFYESFYVKAFKQELDEDKKIQEYFENQEAFTAWLAQQKESAAQTNETKK